jgi:hypothetical protein
MRQVHKGSCHRYTVDEMSLRPQQARPAPLHETLAQQLSQRDLRMVEQLRQFYEPHETLCALRVILEHEQAQERRKARLASILCLAAPAAYALWVVTTYNGESFVTYVIVGLLVRLFYAYVSTFRKGTSLRSTNARFVLPACVQRAGRESLGVVLQLARFEPPSSVAEQSAYREFLEVALVRAPTDELQALTEPQRRALRATAQVALKRSHTDTRYAQLASAGLLALGTLRDPTLRDKATQTTAHHPSSTVQAAAVEYLSQL